IGQREKLRCGTISPVARRIKPTRGSFELYQTLLPAYSHALTDSRNLLITLAIGGWSYEFVPNLIRRISEPPALRFGQGTRNRKPGGVRSRHPSSVSTDLKPICALTISGYHRLTAGIYGNDRCCRRRVDQATG